LNTKSEGVVLIVRTISFQAFQPMWSWSTNVTDRRTDDMRSQDRALRYSASRGKNEKNTEQETALMIRAKLRPTENDAMTCNCAVCQFTIADTILGHMHVLTRRRSWQCIIIIIIIINEFRLTWRKVQKNYKVTLQLS